MTINAETRQLKDGPGSVHTRRDGGVRVRWVASLFVLKSHAVHTRRFSHTTAHARVHLVGREISSARALRCKVAS